MMKLPILCAAALCAMVCLALDNGLRAHGYAVTVPVMNESGLEKLGGRDKVLAELRLLGASRVNFCLDRYECDADRRSAAMQALW